MDNRFTGEDMERILRDAGCCEKLTADIAECCREGKLCDGIRKLRQHRAELLEDLHREQKRLDCLDYLIFMLQKQKNDCCGEDK